MVEKWYRGHSSNQNALDNFGIIWLTDDPYYAEVYAEDGGIISIVYVDESKINAADWWNDDNFEPYFPDDDSIEEFKEEGCNGYYFTASYDGEDFQCLALFDKNPIVKVERYINENKNKYNMKNKKTLKEAIESKRRGHLMNLLMNKIEQNYRYLKSGKKSLVDICKSINVSPQDRRELLRMANDAMNQYEDYRVSQYGFGMAGSDKEYKGRGDEFNYDMSDDDIMMESKKQSIRLTESELKKIISESVKRVLKENIGRSEETYYLYKELQNNLGSKVLCDELADRFDDKTLFNILSDIKSMYNLENEYDDEDEYVDDDVVL